ncbi:DUF2225 domain-containing protein [Thermosipho ferrireducens]|uniref:DUF2225 domain-containing protein n=1 Tax=Thermosipho ferrireducens TaxID=2571116 RepID=A0ABX7S7S2_9BACT|nr:DUF2225 domain-containing protein [Thermosipho ferrireducens]QTA37896.1 DUF2225 domain-containing protein [Thermosipho ferrireducens]
MKILWDKEYKCPYCGKSFSSKKVFIDAIKLEKYDDDLKPIYKNVNPIYYQPIVCPFCNYTEYETEFEKSLSPIITQKLEPTLKKIKKLNLTDVRNLDDAIKAFAMLIIVLTVKDEPCKLGDAYLKSAWLLREKGDEKEEKIALAHTLKHFEKCYRYSNVEGKMEEKILFYLGEINRQFGRKKESIEWFSQLMKRHGKSSSYYVKVARDRWQSMRGSH